MIKACRKSRVGLFCGWLAIKWNDYVTNSARQDLSFLRVERAMYFNALNGAQSIICTDVTPAFRCDYLFGSRTTTSGRTYKFRMQDYDPLHRSAVAAHGQCMTVTYSVCGHRLTALYRESNNSSDGTASFPPYSDFSAYEALEARLPYPRRLHLMHQLHHKQEEKACGVPLNALLEECRGPAGSISKTPVGDWTASTACDPHTWPVDILCMYAASQTTDPRWMRAVEQRQIVIAEEDADTLS